MYGLFWQMSPNRWVSMVSFVRAVCCLWFRLSKECHELGVNGQQVWERTLLWFRSFQFPTARTSSFFQVTLCQYFKTIIENCLMTPENWALSADNSQPSKPGMCLPPQIPRIGVYWLGAAGPGGTLPTEEAAVPMCPSEQLWAPNGLCMFSAQETLCDTTRLWALAAPIKDSWAREQRGASGTMVLITWFIFFLPLLLIWDVWVFLFLPLFWFACFEAAAQKGCWGKGSLQMGLDLSELFNSELFLEVKKKIRWSLP